MPTPYPQSPSLRVTAEGGILRVVMDAPERRNALDDDAVAAFSSALDRAQRDEDVRALLVTGAGGNFCSGFDIVARNAGGGDRPRVGAIQRRLPVQAHRLIPQLYELQVPVVAAVQGYAVGIGLQLALVSDFVVVAEDATLWEPFAARGMTPDSGAAWLLPRVVGPLRARQLLLLGRRLTGAEALEWGLAHECVSAGEVAARADELAAELAAGPTVALGLTKWLLNSGQEQPLKDHLANEALALELASRSPDFREGLSAFVEKRTPDFDGR
jgi:2-(1,2-epoxy-1,2-dihydrophenyl)acetyl-CoA isomerase